MSLKEKAAALRLEISQIIVGYADSPHKLPVFFPPELVERVVQYVKEAARQGISVPQCSEELNIAQARLHYWLYTRKKNVRPPRPSRRRWKPGLRPVQVCAEKVPIYDGVAEKRYTVRSLGGWEVQDLTLVELTELLRGLK